MGAAFVLQHDTSLGCCAQIIHWPSSTQAKLVAIFMALITAPLRSRVKISTDNIAAIQSIDKGLKGLSTKKWLKTPNSLWVMNIVALVKEKGLMLEMVKVKEHSGDTLNDLADELVKEGEFCNFVLDVPFISTNDRLKFFPCYNNIPFLRKLDVSLLHFYDRSFVLNGPA